MSDVDTEALAAECDEVADEIQQHYCGATCEPERSWLKTIRATAAALHAKPVVEPQPSVVTPTTPRAEMRGKIAEVMQATRARRGQTIYESMADAVLDALGIAREQAL